jgi:pilus assembly protein CpaE
MGNTIRTILFTSVPDAGPELRRTLTSLRQIRLIAEIDEPSLLPHAVAQFPAELVLVDLDPNPAVILECVRQIHELTPDLPVFAISSQTDGDIVLKAMRAGIREYLVKPLNVEELEQAASRLAGTQINSKQQGKLISVMGCAGGVGCTAIAANLAVELADLVGPDDKVAIVDLDFRFGHVATMLDVHGQFTVADLCSTPEQLDPEMVLKAMIRHESGVHVLRRPHSFAQAEMITAAHCANVLSTLQELCTYVIVDGPTRHDPGGRSVLDAADHNLLVFQLLVTHVRNADRMMQELAVQGFNTDRISLVCNRLGRDSAHLEVSQVETILNRKILLTLADDWKAVSSSVNIGQPLKTEFPRSKVRNDIRNLARIIHCPETMSAAANKGAGLFGKFFAKKGAPTASKMPVGASAI